MADVNANIDINIDTSDALAQLKSLQRQISQFHTSIAKSSETAALAQRDLQKNLLSGISSIGAFSAEMRTVKTSAESFTDSLEKNKFSMREYFRYAGASTKTFGRLFASEFDTIGKVAEERVKKLQTQYIKMGRDSTGAMKAIAVMPTQLNMDDYSTKVQIAAQKQALFNQLMKQGSTNLLNFGKNTQWAGRQLMVGFTLPLMAVGTAATRTFMEMEAQALKFRKVYGDLFTPQAETQQALDNITELGKMFTKYGIAVQDTVGLAAEAAAAGFQGIDLQRQTTEATRLSVLGQIDNQKALETTISLQNSFGMSSEKLAGAIDFLNAVENQTVVSLDDITTAIPKVAPVIQQLGGDVKDLAFFMTAMKEGGINASEGANALKSGLAALINPTKKASDMLAGYGINIKNIVEKNQGDLKATVIGFAQALDTLAPLQRAKAIEQMFGKFQFARLSTLFQNVTKDGTQASRVLQLAGTSVEDLAALSEQELGMTADSAMNKFKKSVEDLKVALVPVGQAFLQAVTPIIDFVGNILEKFANLSDGTKKVITLLTVGIGGVGPVLLMTFGLLANGIANMIKLFLTLRTGYQRLTGQTQILGEQTQYMTSEQLDAAAAAHSLDQTHAKLTQTFNAEASAVNQLISAYTAAAGAAQRFAAANPSAMLPPRRKGFASGVVSVPGSGNGDTVPAMLTPGEAVIPKAMAKKYAPLIQGMVADNIPGYAKGKTEASRSHLTTPFAAGSAQYTKGIQMAGLQELAAKYPQFIKVVSNLVAELPQSLNILLEKGTAEIDKFTSVWDSKTGKLLSSVKSGGGNIQDQEIIDATSQLEKEIRNRTVALAKETEKKKVSDQLLAQATREVIDEYKLLDTSIGKAAKALDVSSQQVGQVRIQPRAASGNMSNAEYIRQMLASGEFTEDASGNISAGGTRVGRRSKSNLNKVRPASSFNPAGSYTRQPLRGVEAGVENLVDQMDKTARRALESSSPSRRMKRIGVDAADGLAIGVQEGLANNGITTPGRRGGRRATRPQGPPISAIAAGIPVDTNAIKEHSTKLKDASQRLSRMNGAVMAGMFALTSLSGVAQMAGGNLGKLSEIIFQISGPMFALSSIIQMFTGEKILSLLSKFKLGFGLASAALIAGVVAIKLVNDARTKEREAIYGLSNAMKATTDQVKTLGDFFNVVPNTRPFETTGQKEVVGKTTRTARERLKADPGFQKQFAGTIKTLSKATAEEAKLAFTSIALNLKAQGFATEQIQTIVDSLREEAKKTNVVLDVKSLDLSSDSLKGIQNQLAPFLVKFNNAFKTGVTESFKQSLATGEVVKITTFSNDVKKSLADVSTFVSETAKSLSGMFDIGLIKGPEFEATLTGVVETLQGLNVEARNAALIDIFNQMGVNAQPFLNNLQTAKQQMMLMALIGSKVITKESGIFSNLSSTDPNVQLKAWRDIYSEFEKFTKLQDKVNAADPANQQNGPGGPGELNSLQKRIKAIKEQTQAFKILRIAQIDAKTATELSNDAEIAALVIANSKGKSLKQIIALVKQYQQALKDQLSTANKYADPLDKRLANLNQLQNYVTLNEKLIDVMNAPKMKAYNDEITKQEGLLKAVNDQITNITKTQIDPLQARIDANNYALEQISLQEDSINEKFNTQIAALDKVATLNQDIANIQRQRLSIADALTRGDISAAAQMVQDARAEQAQSAVSGQQEALITARDQAINALGRLSIEKQNKELQFQISTIQRGQLLTLQTQKNTIEEVIAKNTEDLNILQQKVQQEKENYRYAGLTKDEISSQKDLIEAAIPFGDTYKDILKNSSLSAQAMASALWSAVSAQQALASANALKSSTSTTTTSPLANSLTSKIAKMEKLGLANGGLVPKYFAVGGKAIGSDTIPAMLTPGEFIVNKSAAKQYKPLLESINQSKYPAMIGSDYAAGMTVNNISTAVSDNSSAVYNYSLGFNINGNSSNPNEIARAVIEQIKQIDSQRIRGQRR